MLLLLLISLSQVYGYLNNWFPVLPLSSTDFSNPHQVRILGKDFVVWKRDDQLIIQDDVCPHRCAPLSEGYLDPKSGNLRCSYHGWEFNNHGNCTVIPQLSNTSQISTMRKCDLRTYPVIQHEDIMWTYLGTDKPKTTPVKKFNLGNTDTFMREVPNNMYIVLENFFDPAHIPFAHHKLQSLRSKGCPINIDLLWNDKSILSMLFHESTCLSNNHSRSGIMEFEIPCYYRLTVLRPSLNLFSNLHLFMVPIQEDKTRLFIKFQLNKENKWGYKMFTHSPIWLKHVLINIFLDSDTLILHKQEKYLQTLSDSYHNHSAYFTPTKSDKAVLLYRKWVSKYLPKIPFFHHRIESKELTRNQILDRYNQHTIHCVHCKKILKVCQVFQKVGTFLWGKLFSQTKNPLFLAGAFINYIIFGKATDLFRYQDYIHNKIN